MTAVLAMTDADYAPRYCADRILGGRVHDFLKLELADTSIEWLMPRCQEGAMYPVPQPRLEMREERPQRDHVCEACLSLRRRGQVEGTHEPQ